MRVVLQRVSQASVAVDGTPVGSIGNGLLLLVGIAVEDEEADVDAAVAKVVGLRVFEDADAKMNLSLLDVGGEALVVSQFTLLAELRRGRRPSFSGAAQPDLARRLVDRFARSLAEAGIETATGRFGGRMEVSLVNSGPVTLIVDTHLGRVV